MHNGRPLALIVLSFVTLATGGQTAMGRPDGSEGPPKALSLMATLICGESDQISPALLSLETASTIRGWALHVFSRCGHMVTPEEQGATIHKRIYPLTASPIVNAINVSPRIHMPDNITAATETDSDALQIAVGASRLPFLFGGIFALCSAPLRKL